MRYRPLASDLYIERLKAVAQFAGRPGLRHLRPGLGPTPPGRSEAAARRVSALLPRAGRWQACDPGSVSVCAVPGEFELSRLRLGEDLRLLLCRHRAALPGRPRHPGLHPRRHVHRSAPVPRLRRGRALPRFAGRSKRPQVHRRRRGVLAFARLRQLLARAPTKVSKAPGNRQTPPTPGGSQSGAEGGSGFLWGVWRYFGAPTGFRPRGGPVGGGRAGGGVRGGGAGGEWGFPFRKRGVGWGGRGGVLRPGASWRGRGGVGGFVWLPARGSPGPRGVVSLGFLPRGGGGWWGWVGASCFPPLGCHVAGWRGGGVGGGGGGDCALEAREPVARGSNVFPQRENSQTPVPQPPEGWPRGPPHAGGPPPYAAGRRPRGWAPRAASQPSD